MARLRSSKLLTCFYCGKRSGLKFDGLIRDFLCLHCDATNYLDQNGEITDPPVATEREAPPTSYVLPQLSNSPEESIFCQKCLHNQHLFTKSLAQYFPDDPSDPEYEELDRNYYRFRRGLEERYPQVCDDCAAKVDNRLRKAAYTARTDHLRRAMERSRRRRDGPKTTALDWVHTFGKWSWWSGFAAQMLWHLVLVAQVLERRDDGMYDPDDDSILATAASALKHVTEVVPQPDTLMQWSITAAVLSSWWNPHFVQFNRGFTRHLLGFTQWYSFQGLIVFFRVGFRSVLNLDGGLAQSRNAQLSAHLVMAIGMALIYILAGRSITVDTAPLFGTSDGGLSPKRSPKQPVKQSAPLERRKPDDSKTLSELLTEALDSPGAIASPQISNASPSTFSPIPPFSSNDSPRPSFGGFEPFNNTPQRVQEVQYAEEMDWSPIPPVPRALSGESTNQVRPFGQAPVREETDPFWFRVPAAPTTPAERLRNPRQIPTLMRKPVEQQSPQLFPTKSSDQRKQETSRRVSGDVDFRQPRFFAPEENDEASSLADMLGRSFTLSQEEEQSKAEKFKKRSKGSMWRASNGDSGVVQKKSPTNVVMPILVAAALSIWVASTYLTFSYIFEVRLAALLAGGVTALIGTSDPNRRIPTGQALGPKEYVLSLFSAVELGAVCWVAWEVCRQQSDVAQYGTGVLAIILGHQTWNASS